MKMFYLPLMALLLSAVACESRKTTDATQTSDTVVAQSTDNPAPAAPSLTPRLQELGLNPAHDWQQVKLGDDFATLKAGSKAETFEQDARHVGYTREFDNLESVDYQYFQVNGKVNKIQVDLYLNNAKSAADYQKELVDYYSSLHGEPEKTAQEMTWQQGKITLRNVSKDKDYGLRLVIN